MTTMTTVVLPPKLTTPTPPISSQPQLLLIGTPSFLTTESYGLLLLLLSAMLYAIMALFVQLASQSTNHNNDNNNTNVTTTGTVGSNTIPSTELVFIRALVQGSLVVLAMFYYQEDEKVDFEVEEDATIAYYEEEEDEQKILKEKNEVEVEEGKDGTITTTTTTSISSSSLSLSEHPQQPQPHSQQQEPPRQHRHQHRHRKRRRRLLIQIPFGITFHTQCIVLLRGIIGGIGFLFYFYTISILPLGDAVALLSLSPVITVIASSIFFPENNTTGSVGRGGGGRIHFHPLHMIAALASVLGTIFIAQPTFLFGGSSSSSSTTYSSSSSIGYITALLGTCCGSSVFLLMRKAGQIGTVHTLQLLFSWSIFGLLFSFILGILLPTILNHIYTTTSTTTSTTTTTTTSTSFHTSLSTFSLSTTWILPQDFSYQTWWYILGLCTFGSIAHFLMNFAARYSNAGLASIIRSSGILWAYLLQMITYHEIPSLKTLLGVICITCSLVLVTIQKMNDNTNTTTKNNENHEKEEEEETTTLLLKSLSRNDATPPPTTTTTAIPIGYGATHQTTKDVL